MATNTLTRLVTYDDYRKLPNDGNQYQIIGGELYMTPAPSPYHQEISLNLASILRSYLKQHNLGKVYSAPIDVVLSMTEVVQPDLVFVAKERLNIITKKNIVAAPDLVMEILSEHTETIDRKKKKELYEKYGVIEYWIVDPDNKQIEQYVLQQETFQLHAAIAADQQLSSIVLDDFSLPLNEVFGQS